MKKINIIMFVMAALIVSACGNSASNNNQQQSTATQQTSTATQMSTGIFPKGEEIKNDNFSGRAWHQRLVTDKENFDVTVGNVIFEPGVRNSWHSHPGGQILFCLSGKGYYQERGKPIQLLNVGDVVEILPNVVHWHGATPDSPFEHLAIGTQQNKGGAVWYEPVTDEEYNSYGK